MCTVNVAYCNLPFLVFFFIHGWTTKASFKITIYLFLTDLFKKYKVSRNLMVQIFYAYFIYTYCILYHTDYIKYLIIYFHCWSMINYISGLLVQYQSFPIDAIIFANMEDCVDYCEQNNYNNDILGKLNISIHNDMTIVWNGTTVILRIINFILHNVVMYECHRSVQLVDKLK